MAKKKTENAISETIVTIEGVLDHFAILEADSYEDGDKDPAYKAHIIFDKDSPDRGKQKGPASLEQIALQVFNEAFPKMKKEQADAWALKIRDEAFLSRKENPEKTEYLKDKIWMAPARKEKLGRPQCFYWDHREKTKVKLGSDEEIKEKFYRGCRVILSLIISSYDFAGKKGTTSYLNSIIFIRDGEPLSPAGSEFNDLDIEPGPDLDMESGASVDEDIGANI